MPKNSHDAQVGVVWQEVSVPVVQGLDARDNDRVRSIARPSRLLNGSFKERNQIVKRDGHIGGPIRHLEEETSPVDQDEDAEWVYGVGECLPSDHTYPVYAGRPRKAAGVVLRDEQFAAWTGDRLFSYDVEADGYRGRDHFWTSHQGEAQPKGVALFAPSGPVRDVPVPASYGATQHCVVKGRNYLLTAWLDEHVFVRVETFDGATVVSELQVTSDDYVENVDYIKALWVGGHFGVVVSSSDGGAYIAHASEGEVASWSVDSLAENVEAGCWDIAKASDELAILLFRDTSDDLRATYFTHLGGVNSPAMAQTLIDTDSNPAEGAVAVTVAPNGHVGMLWTSGDTVQCKYVTAALTGGSDVEEFYSEAGDRLTLTAGGIEVATNSYRYFGFVEIEGNDVSTFDGTWASYFGASGVASADYSEFRYYMAIAGGAFTVGNVPMVTLRTMQLGDISQQTLVLMAGIREPKIVGAWARAGAREFTDLPRFPDFLPDQDFIQRTRWALSFSHEPRYSRPQAPSGPLMHQDAPQTFAETRGIWADLDFLPALSSARAGGSVYFAGAQPQVWDGGQNVHEAGFLQWPEHIEEPDHNAGGGGALTAGVRSYRVYYARRNRFGEVTRSPAITVSCTAGATGITTLVLSPLVATADPDVYFEIYRTEADGSVFHLLTGFDAASATQNNRHTEAITVEDGVSDAAIAGSPSDPYASAVGAPAELEESALPGCESIAAVGDRLWFAGGLAPAGTVYFSKQFEPGETVGWNDLGVLQYTLDRRNARITAVGPVSSGVAVFREDEVFVFGGDGPDNLGNGAFGSARRVPSDLGAVSQAAVAPYLDGLGFWSPLGPRVLTDQLSVAILGDEILPFADEEAVAAVAVPSASQLRFYMPGGFALVYDYVARAWAQHTGLNAVAACYWPAISGAALVRENGRALFESTEVKTDLGLAYEYLIRFSGLRPGELLQGSHRCRRLAVTGRAEGEHTLEISVYFDGSPFVGESYSWDVAADMDFENVYAPDPTLSIVDGVYRVRKRLDRQRFSSLAVEFSDSFAAGDSFVITELALELGVKPGLTRLSSRSI